MSKGPKITEDYQRTLKTFLTAVPDLGGEIRSGDPVTPYPYTENTLNEMAKNKVFRTNSLFKKYTGYEHETLLRKWLKDITTTCNEFCRECCYTMGMSEGLNIGRFDVADWLTTRGLGHCWVPVDSGATPEYGDVYRLLGYKPAKNGVLKNHLGISLYLDGSTWYTVDSGQGGRMTGCDKIMRMTRPWKPSSLRGWVSMKSLLNSSQPLPIWLGGWWEVREAPYNIYYYHFAANGKVTCTTHKPASASVAPITASLVGTFSSKRMFEVQISWHSEDVDETLTCAYKEKTRWSKMVGKTARGIKLTGERLLRNSRFE